MSTKTKRSQLQVNANATLTNLTEEFKAEIFASIPEGKRKVGTMSLYNAAGEPVLELTGTVRKSKNGNVTVVMCGKAPIEAIEFSLADQKKAKDAPTENLDEVRQHLGL